MRKSAAPPTEYYEYASVRGGVEQSEAHDWPPMSIAEREEFVDAQMESVDHFAHLNDTIGLDLGDHANYRIMNAAKIVQEFADTAEPDQTLLDKYDARLRAYYYWFYDQSRIKADRAKAALEVDG